MAGSITKTFPNSTPPFSFFSHSVVMFNISSARITIAKLIFFCFYWQLNIYIYNFFSLLIVQFLVANYRPEILLMGIKLAVESVTLLIVIIALIFALRRCKCNNKIIVVENWKHCNKIIFKCVNSIVGSIFNIF